MVIEYSPVVNRYPAIYVISYRVSGRKMAKQRLSPAFLSKSLLYYQCVVKQNNYPAQSCRISSDFSPLGLRAFSAKYQAIFRAISQDIVKCRGYAIQWIA